MSMTYLTEDITSGHELGVTENFSQLEGGLGFRVRSLLRAHKAEVLEIKGSGN